MEQLYDLGVISSMQKLYVVQGVIVSICVSKS